MHSHHVAPFVIPMPILAAFFLVGCLPAGVLDLKVDPRLTIKQLDQNGVAILPALASSPAIDEGDLAPLRAQLTSELAKRRPTLALVGEGRVDSALREHPEFWPVLRRFARTGFIPCDELRALSVAMGTPVVAPDHPPSALSTATRTPFIVLLVLNEYSFDMSGTTGQPIESSTRETSVRLGGTLSIFNAVECRPVWVGTATINERVTESDQADIIARAGDWVYYRIKKAQQPMAPEVTKLIPRLFKTLVSRWPS